MLKSSNMKRFAVAALGIAQLYSFSVQAAMPLIQRRVGEDGTTYYEVNIYTGDSVYQARISEKGNLNIDTDGNGYYASFDGSWSSGSTEEDKNSLHSDDRVFSVYSGMSGDSVNMNDGRGAYISDIKSSDWLDIESASVKKDFRKR